MDMADEREIEIAGIVRMFEQFRKRKVGVKRIGLNMFL